MEKISNNPDDVNWTYYVDHTTDSIYLVKETTYQFGISPVLNSDGTLMTLEQLINTRWLDNLSTATLRGGFFIFKYKVA